SDALVKGNYRVKLGHPDAAKHQGPYECFVDEIRRCGQLGATLLNILPEWSVSPTTPSDSCALIAECMNKVHQDMTGGIGADVVVALENMVSCSWIRSFEASYLSRRMHRAQ
ncbi:hypothetical protein BKA70DRAFT_1122195, partial [Coprinopsis sp. MPI-PUGE-AT-0042]